MYLYTLLITGIVSHQYINIYTWAETERHNSNVVTMRATYDVIWAADPCWLIFPTTSVNT